MTEHFDLLTQPWIPVTDCEGNTEELGILETLARAHELQNIADNFILAEYTLYRFFCVFLMDALRPDKYDIEKLLDEGSFDMEKIYAYIDICHQEGNCFDLFDEKRPFMQTTYCEEWDRDKKPVSYLDCRIPTGNSHIHFNHLDEKTSLSYAQSARFLLTCSLFSTAQAQDYPSSINAAPPFFTLIKEKNLFETLACMLISVDDIEDLDSTPVFWRSKRPVIPKEKIVSISWLYGMFFPARRVLLIPESGRVDKIYFSQGMNFCEPANWTDPHVTYCYGTKGRFPWRPNSKKAVWRNLNNLIDIKDKHAPKILEVYKEIHRQHHNNIQDQAKFINLHYYDLQIPASLIQEGSALLLEKCILECEKLSKELKKSLKCCGITEHMGDEAVQNYFKICEAALWQLCREKISSFSLDGDKIFNNWQLQLYEIGRHVLNHISRQISLTGKEWIDFYKKQEKFQRYLLKLKKEGEMTDE